MKLGYMGDSSLSLPRTWKYDQVGYLFDKNLFNVSDW